MFKKIALSLCFAALIAPAYVYADTSCATKYPVVFSHGIGENNEMFGFDGSYFYGVKSAVNSRGCNSYYTNVDCMATKEAKAAQYKAQVLSILAVTGASKINVIGHSDGTLYTRLSISNLGLASKVASYTSICGVHRGSATADVVTGLIDKNGITGVAMSVVVSALDAFYTYIIGDSSGTNNEAQAKCLTTSYMAAFNKNVPNASGVYYQSWATKIKVLPTDMANMGSFVMQPIWLLECVLEGDNDGVVAVSSAKWGNFRGTESGAWWCYGVSHLNATGQFFGVTPGFSAADFYVNIIKELKTKGY